MSQPIILSRDIHYDYAGPWTVAQTKTREIVCGIRMTFRGVGCAKQNRGDAYDATEGEKWAQRRARKQLNRERQLAKMALIGG